MEEGETTEELITVGGGNPQEVTMSTGENPQEVTMSTGENPELSLAGAANSGLSLVITDDGQYSLVNVDPSGAASVAPGSGLGESTQVFVEGEEGIEIMYIVQPESSDGSVNYDNSAGTEGIQFVNVDGNVVQVLADNTSYGTNATPASDYGVNTIPANDGELAAQTLIAEEMPDTIISGDGQEQLMNGTAGEAEEEFDVLFCCQYCGENLQTYAELKTHLRDEHGDEAVDDNDDDDDDIEDITESVFPTCRLCGLTFIDEEDLDAHLKKCDSEFDDERPDERLDESQETDSIIEEDGVLKFDGHRCQLCGAMFQARWHLTDHIEKHHDESREDAGCKGGVSRMYHRCPYCPKMYMSKWHKKSLIKHIKEEHEGKPWNVIFDLVEVEDKKVRRRSNAKKGMYESCHPCFYCDRKFLWQKSLARHYKEMHQDRLDKLEELELSELLGKNTSRTTKIFGEGGNLSCDTCGTLFLWKKNLDVHKISCSGVKEDASSATQISRTNEAKGDQKEFKPKLGDGILLKCIFCDLVTKYVCSMRKHIKRFHANEIRGIDIRSLEIPVVKMDTHGHNLISNDKRPADERLKDYPVIFKCKFCDYVSAGQSNLKRHLMSIKHGYTNAQLKEMKLSSFKVIQKPKQKQSHYLKQANRKSEVNKNNKVDAEIDQAIKTIEDQEGEKLDGTSLFEDAPAFQKIPRDCSLKQAAVTRSLLKSDDTNVTPINIPETTPEGQDNTVNIAATVTQVQDAVSMISDEKDIKSSEKPDETVEEVSVPESTQADVPVTGSETLPSSKTECIVCPITGARFTDFDSFRDHAMKYPNLKVEFKCLYSLASFPMFESLKKHHEHKYPGLDFTATRMSSVSVEEVKAKKSRVKAFECPYSDMIFSQAQALKQHISENFSSYVITFSVKSESAALKNSRGNFIAGYRCGFCELKFCCVEDLVTHMQIIHPFADKSSLGRGVSDSGSVRKSGRKRKPKYPRYDSDEDDQADIPDVPVTKRARLDFKSPEPPRTVKRKKPEINTKIDTAAHEESFELNQADENKTANQDDTNDKNNTEIEEVEKIPFMGEIVGIVQTGPRENYIESLNLQPVVVLDKKVNIESPKMDDKEQVVKKKRGRKRKEDKVETAAKVPVVSASHKKIADSTTGNKCPYCSFTCKRSSALTFHINFNHAKIKQEPIDKEFDEIESPSKSKTNRSVQNKSDDESDWENDVSTGHRYKHVKAIIAQQTGRGGKQNEPTVTGGTGRQVNKTPATELHDDDMEEEISDNDLDLDDSDVDQNYKPSGDEDDDDDYAQDDDDGDDDDDLLDEINSTQKIDGSNTVSSHEVSSEKTPEGQSKNKSSENKQWFDLPKKEEWMPVKKEPSASPATKLRCSVCAFLCKTKSGLKKHMTRCHPRFEQSTSVVMEVKADLIGGSCNKFACPHCKYKSYHKTSLVRHVKSKHPLNVADFDVDSSIHMVKNHDRLMEKMGSVAEDSHFCCPYCGIINKWKKSIIRHIQTTHPDQPKDVHIESVDIKDKKVKTEKQRFSIGYKKMLKCLHCSFICKRLVDMKKHIKRLHDIGRPRVQADYQYMYRKSQHQNDLYMNQIQNETGMFQCPICKLEYGWKKSLHYHIKQHHKQQLNVYNTLDKVVSIVAQQIVPKKTTQKSIKTAVKKKPGVKRPYMKNKVWKFSKLWRGIKDTRGCGYQGIACKHCGKRCKTLQTLRVHNYIYHRETTIECLYHNCSTRFIWRSTLQRHLQIVHGHSSHPNQDDSYKCELCNKFYDTSLDLQTHLDREHLSKKPKRKPFVFSCKQCELCFDSQNERDFHVQVEHIELTEICDICGGVFSSKKKLEVHKKIHENHPIEDTVMCSYCGKTMNKKSLSKHLLFKHTETLSCDCTICSGSDPTKMTGIYCELCNKQFCQKTHLYAHKRLYHQAKENVYNCKVCSASFASQKLRNIHVHEKHFQPNQPNVEQDESNTMQIWTSEENKDRTTHVIHVGQGKGAQYLPKLSDASLSAVIKELVIMSTEKNADKPFKCLLCGRSFNKSKYIKLHIRRNHIKDEDKPYRCKVCGSGFVRLTEFRKHSRAHSGFRPYKCKICHKAFKQQANLTDHMHIHKDTKDFQCFICKREFQQRGGLTSHVVTHDTIKPFKCMYCEKGFSSRGELSRHMQKYSSEMSESKSFMCHICQTSFPHFPILLRHIETHNPEKPFPCEVCGMKFGSYVAMYSHKVKQSHFMLSDIQLAQVVEEQPNEKEMMDAQAGLEIDMYEDGKIQEVGEEQTIYISQEALAGFVDSDNHKTTIIIEPGMGTEEVVQTTDKLHDNEELLSIAKQLTELSTYTENDPSHMDMSETSHVEISIIHDENEIMKDMLDADREVLASIEKQSIKLKHIIDNPRRKIPETIEEILQQHKHELIITEDDQGVVNEEEVSQFLDQQVEHQEERTILEDQPTVIEPSEIKQDFSEPTPLEQPQAVTTEASLTTTAHMEELAALIKQSQDIQQNNQQNDTTQITAFEAGDGVIYVCMPENVDRSSYEAVLNSAMHTITRESASVDKQTVQEHLPTKVNAADPIIENEGNVDQYKGYNQIVGLDINKLPEDAVKGVEQIDTFQQKPRNCSLNQAAVTSFSLKSDKMLHEPEAKQQRPNTDHTDFLPQESLNLYNDPGNSVIELSNDENSFIKEEVLEDVYPGKWKATLENGIFDYQGFKLPYEYTKGMYKCLACGRLLAIKKRLKEHLKRHIPEEYREYPCMFCPKKFVTQNELGRHITKHTDDRRYRCMECGKGFRQPGHLTEHMRIHQDVKPYACMHCDRAFRTKRNLTVHIQNVHDEDLGTPYKCDQCDKAYKSKITLMIHKGSMHSKTFKKLGKGKRLDQVDPDEGCEHQCHKCGMAYRTKSSLMKHLNAHDGLQTKPNSYICEYCGVSYHSKVYLRDHIANIHSDEATNICDMCGDAFKTVRQLLVHRRKKHDTYVRPTGNKKDVPKKFHNCVVCNKKYSTRHALAYHIGVSPECQNKAVIALPTEK